MGVSVKQSEQSDERHRHNGSQLHSERDGETHDHNGKADARLDKRQRIACITEDSAHHHRGDEGQGNQPQRCPAKTCRVKTDRDHGNDVIDPAQRVVKPGRERFNLAYANMGEGRTRA